VHGQQNIKIIFGVPLRKICITFQGLQSCPFPLSLCECEDGDRSLFRNILGFFYPPMMGIVRNISQANYITPSWFRIQVPYRMFHIPCINWFNGD